MGGRSDPNVFFSPFDHGLLTPLPKDGSTIELDVLIISLKECSMIKLNHPLIFLKEGRKDY